MIVGIGVDLVETKRIKRAHERFGERFLNRVFCLKESQRCLEKKDPYMCLSARFAAKEAFSKALGTGIRGGLRLNQICITNDDLGAPKIVAYGKAETL